VLFKYLLSSYHYLGFSRTVGENLKYLVFDRKDNPVACLLFGSATWKIAPRDNFIGWDEARRGVRRSKEDPSRLEYIFGYNKVTLTLKDPLLGIELSSDSVTKEGSIYEGNFLIQLRKRFKEQHPRLILRWHRASPLSTKRSKAIEPLQREVIPTVRKMIWIS